MFRSKRVVFFQMTHSHEAGGCKFIQYFANAMANDSAPAVRISLVLFAFFINGLGADQEK
jgi:hypothetical protein